MKHFLSFYFIGGITLLWTTVLCPKVDAQNYIGANAVLREVQERNGKASTQTNDAQSVLRNDLKAFSQDATNLAPADAAKQWLGLVDRAYKLQQLQRQSFNSSQRPIDANGVLGALPPPLAWNDLAKAIAARPRAQDENEMHEMGLHLLAAALTGNVQTRNVEITNLQAKASEGNPGEGYYYRELLRQASEAMLAESSDPDAVLNSLEHQLNSKSIRNEMGIEVPNLVSQVGREKAEAFLRKALVTPDVSLRFRAPNETSRLAQQLALELVDQLKMPQWGLVNSLDAVQLYEAMDKRFGNQTNSAPAISTVTETIATMGGSMAEEVDDNFAESGSKGTAQIYYMLGLISEGRTQDAVAVAKKCKGYRSYYFDNAFEAMDRAGYSIQLDNFLNGLLSQDPTLPFWNEYVQFSAKAGQTDRMLALVRSTLNRPDLSEAKKSGLQQILFTALLAADNVDEGVHEIQRLIATNTPPVEGVNNYNSGQLGVLLARIGILTTNQEWTAEGITAATNWLASGTGENLPYGQDDVIGSLTRILWEINRGPEAEAILTDAMANATRQQASQMDYSGMGIGAPSSRILTQLAILYFKAGRYDDVLDLLENSPDWNAKDLSELFDADPWDDEFNVRSIHSGTTSLPMPYVAASTLKEKGQIEEAQRITDALLEHDPALDRGYELLIAINGTNALPRLDELYKNDQFQTRPLIWKAYLLMQEGQWEEAEKTVRQAIAVDPSDGESGRGDRMRAYVELADIREARGDKKEADSYRQIVQAIRISENADQFYTAGLLKHAITMYEEGLDHFSDAYCIQSRLAIQLAALGKTEEAAEHYRRAYELMPDSFGRVESHCFGCERVFEGEQAQSIAEKVFTQLVAARPDKPQVYYLLGYLQSEQEHYNQAWTNFSTAVRLDPDYLNAWVQMQSASQEILVAPSEKNKIVFNLLRLDPLQRHSSPDFSHITDLPGLWDAVAVAVALRPKPDSNLFPLTASRVAREKRASNSDARDMEMQEEGRQDNRDLSPASAVAQTPFVSLAGTLMFSETPGSGIE